jgi:hypothetical protein
MARYL